MGFDRYREKLPLNDGSAIITMANDETTQIQRQIYGDHVAIKLSPLN